MAVYVLSSMTSGTAIGAAIRRPVRRAVGGVHRTMAVRMPPQTMLVTGFGVPVAVTVLNMNFMVIPVFIFMGIRI